MAGDLNDDGRPDIVTASSTDNTIAVFFNEGNRTFSRKRALTYEAKGARMVALGDVDGDGALDVVFGAYYDNTVGWFRNDGDALRRPETRVGRDDAAAARPLVRERIAATPRPRDGSSAGGSRRRRGRETGGL